MYWKHHSATEQELKGTEPEKEGITLSLFVGNMMVYIEMLRNQQKLEKLVSTFSKVPGTRLTQKTQLYFYIITSNT